MTAHASGDDRTDRSIRSWTWSRHPGQAIQSAKGRWSEFLCTCVVTGSLVTACQGVVAEQVTGSPLMLDSVQGGLDSVLVGDGPADQFAPPGNVAGQGLGQGEGGPVADAMPRIVGPSVAADAIPWESIQGCGAPGRWGGGGACGPADDRGGDQFFEAGGTPCDPCHEGCRPGCLWAIQADALVLWRNNFAGQPLLIGSDGAVALDAGDVRTAAAAGPRIGLLRSLGAGRAIEVNYFNVGGIQGRSFTDGTGAPFTPVGLANLPFTDIESAGYTTRGQIKSAELNYRWCDGGRVIWLAGMRWVEWNEVAAVDMQSENPAAGGNDIRTTTGNDLYGGQFGCRLRFWNWGKWQAGAVGKAGVFGNSAYQRTTVLVDSEPFGPLAADDTTAAFFGEVGINSTIWLNSWLAWRLGYNFFWLQGVATAAQQFSLNNFGSDTASIDSNDAVFLQGVSTGLEARW
jgi:hypothetical protein